MVMSIFYFANAIRRCERPLSRPVLNPDGTKNSPLFSSYLNCMWNVVITMVNLNI
jgi:hypothetical protein